MIQINRKLKAGIEEIFRAGRDTKGLKRKDQKPRDQYLLYNYLQLSGLLGDQIVMREETTEEGERDRERETVQRLRVI